MSGLPLVSLLMAVHNTGSFLDEALDSALAETYPNFELLVYDDVSTDRSPEIIARYAARDPRVRAFRGEEKAASLAAIDRFLLARAHGAYFIHTDSDDLFAPNRVERLVDAAWRNPAASGAFGKANDFSGDRSNVIWTFGHPATPFSLFLNNCAANSATLVSREHYDRTDGYNVRTPWAEDYEIRLKLVEQGPLVFVDEVVFDHRRHGASMTSTRHSAAVEHAFRAKVAERNMPIVRQVLAAGDAAVGYREAVAIQYVAAYLARYRKRAYEAYRLVRRLKDAPLPLRLTARLFFFQATRSRKRRGARILAAYNDGTPDRTNRDR